MTMSTTKIKTSDKAALTEVLSPIKRKYPHGLVHNSENERNVFFTGLPSFDRLFFGGGIPFGQLIEITGNPSCGKTSLVLHVLAQLTKTTRVAFMDTSNMFYPGAAVACGVDLNRLILVKPQTLSEAFVTTESLLRNKLVSCVVCDLAGQRGDITAAHVHRLRTNTVRAKALVFFVTEGNSTVIPPSTMSLQLTVQRKDRYTVLVTVAKSRISRVGAGAEVKLYER